MFAAKELKSVLETVPDDAYCSPAVETLRENLDSVCVDDSCDLSGGYAHVGICESCDCGLRHAVDECPAIHPELAT